MLRPVFRFFFFNDTATTEIYTLSLHDALPIWPVVAAKFGEQHRDVAHCVPAHVAAGSRKFLDRLPEGLRRRRGLERDRKSTRLNSSHGYISYAVFCLKKKEHFPDT